jgi:hypothetical protein
METMNQIRPQAPSMPERKSSGNNMTMILVGVFAVVVLGVASAWLISSKLINKSSSRGAAPGAIVTKTEAGLLDPNAKYDTTTGDLKDGGIGNEGTQHLEVESGPSHYVYLTSSVVDLKSFVGKKVQVWGQTLASKKAPWLIEVSKVQVVQ